MSFVTTSHVLPPLRAVRARVLSRACARACSLACSRSLSRSLKTHLQTHANHVQCQFFFGGGGLAAGHLILAEAGGVVTDMTGQRLDFGHGAKLLRNTGVVSAVMPMGINIYAILEMSCYTTKNEGFKKKSFFFPHLF